MYSHSTALLDATIDSFDENGFKNCRSRIHFSSKTSFGKQTAWLVIVTSTICSAGKAESYDSCNRKWKFFIFDARIRIVVLTSCIIAKTVEEVFDLDYLKLCL